MFHQGAACFKLTDFTDGTVADIAPRNHRNTTFLVATGVILIFPSYPWPHLERPVFSNPSLVHPQTSIDGKKTSNQEQKKTHPTVKQQQSSARALVRRAHGTLPPKIDESIHATAKAARVAAAQRHFTFTFLFSGYDIGIGIG